eukprot:TRINITY_DN37060_c0_g1_i1.p1 TRINITY_DN37060_c0_g1~~TRINITY_DN37060_c0_g1_i1.p1  ORF type:complete len:423 (+),score=74.61 TRINITY_DN37060_c0_g1_i1:144-1271(+)
MMEQSSLAAIKRLGKLIKRLILIQEEAGGERDLPITVTSAEVYMVVFAYSVLSEESGARDTAICSLHNLMLFDATVHYARVYLAWVHVKENKIDIALKMLDVPSQSGQDGHLEVLCLRAYCAKCLFHEDAFRKDLISCTAASKHLSASPVGHLAAKGVRMLSFCSLLADSVLSTFSGPALEDAMCGALHILKVSPSMFCFPPRVVHPIGEGLRRAKVFFRNSLPDAVAVRWLSMFRNTEVMQRVLAVAIAVTVDTVDMAQEALLALSGCFACLAVVLVRISRKDRTRRRHRTLPAVHPFLCLAAVACRQAAITSLFKRRARHRLRARNPLKPVPSLPCSVRRTVTAPLVHAADVYLKELAAMRDYECLRRKIGVS